MPPAREAGSSIRTPASLVEANIHENVERRTYRALTDSQSAQGENKVRVGARMLELAAARKHGPAAGCQQLVASAHRTFDHASQVIAPVGVEYIPDPPQPTLNRHDPPL